MCRFGGAVTIKGRRGRLNAFGPCELRSQIPAVPVQDRARDRFEQHPLGAPHPVPSEEVRAAGTMKPGAPGPIVQDVRELRLHLVQVTGRMLVEDDDIGAQTLQAPVFLRLQDLPHQRRIVITDNPDEEDREIAGDGVRPQS